MKLGRLEDTLFEKMITVFRMTQYLFFGLLLLTKQSV